MITITQDVKDGVIFVLIFYKEVPSRHKISLKSV